MGVDAGVKREVKIYFASSTEVAIHEQERLQPAQTQLQITGRDPSQLPVWPLHLKAEAGTGAVAGTLGEVVGIGHKGSSGTNSAPPVPSGFEIGGAEQERRARVNRLDLHTGTGAVSHFHHL